jgi:hypothetical protein
MRAPLMVRSTTRRRQAHLAPSEKRPSRTFHPPFHPPPFPHHFPTACLVLFAFSLRAPPAKAVDGPPPSAAPPLPPHTAPRWL